VKNAALSVSVVVEKDGIFQEITGDKLLVALGRAPAVKGLGLENAGVQTDKRGYIITDGKLRTNIKNIFACGDCTGPYLFTHTAGYQGSLVVRNLIFPFKAKVNYSALPWVTYTKPEVAHAGLTEQVAVAKGVFKKMITVGLGAMDRSLTEGEEAGFLKIVISKKNRIAGVTIVAEKAGELLLPSILAIAKKMRLPVFTSIVFPYPIQSEIYKTAAYASLKDSFKPWMKNLVKKFFL
jgi:pyruvate/2-oxoglutarate dehydrogenase complex dihydrolipoamide dehydrogenase (E3) component